MFTELIESIDVHGIISPSMSNIQKIEVIEWYLKNSDFQVKFAGEYDYEHIFQKGLYIRRLYIPAGDMVIGMLHNTFHINKIISGDGIVMNGNFITNVSSGFEFYSDAGDKKALVAITDIVYETQHVTNETDLEKIKADTVRDSDLSWIEALPWFG